MQIFEMFTILYAFHVVNIFERILKCKHKTENDFKSSANSLSSAIYRHENIF